jgi:hypothetical protein
MGTVANLAVRIGANTQGLEKDLAGVEQSVGGVSSRLRAVGAAVAASFGINEIGAAAERAIEAGSHFQDLAERIGISAEAVQRLDFAARQSGSSFEAIQTGMRTMSKAIESGKIPKALTDMGLSAEKLKTMSLDQAFLAIGNAAMKIENPIQRMQVFAQMFGRGGVSLMAPFKNGMVDIANTAPVMSNAVVASLDATGDKWREMHLQLDNLRAQALAPLLDLFLSMNPKLQTVAAGIATFMPSLEGIGIAIIAAGGPKAALAMLLEAGGAIGTFFSTALPALLAGAVTFFTTTLPAAFTAAIAFLGPQGLIALAVIALGLIWYKWGDQISAVVANVYNAVKTWLVDKFNAIVASITGKIQYVGDKFKWLYDVVVGKSYVPDLIKGIEGCFGNLDSVMVKPVETAASMVEGIFERLLSRITGKLGGGGAAGGVGAGLGGGITGALTQLIGKGLNMIPGIGPLLATVAPKLGQLAWTGIKKLGSKIWGGIKHIFGFGGGKKDTPDPHQTAVSSGMYDRPSWAPSYRPAVSVPRAMAVSGRGRVEVHNHISTIDWQGVRDFVQSTHFTSAVNLALSTNKGFMASTMKRVTAET